MGTIIRISAPEALLKRGIRRHFSDLGFKKSSDGTLNFPGEGKDVIRQLHREQRAQRVIDSHVFLRRALPTVMPFFAEGHEIDPSKIRFKLTVVKTGTVEADIFRVASLTWSVPVSPGFGRRMRYLVWDEHHNRLAGIIALGDPVYNLSVRDKLVGWSVHDRALRLVNVLDAYVLGAVPPYNALLAGKAVACLIRSQEIFDDFKASYGASVGVISKQSKRADLLAVTTSSSMGRSSVYNRLNLDGKKYFDAIGYTVGWGHFHITNDLFAQMRDYLRLIQHPYADKHGFGEGPNWRLRTIKVALKELGINKAVLRHGIQREVFLSTFCDNALSILRKGIGQPNLDGLRKVDEISELSRERWIVPRSKRDSSYKNWRREQIPALIQGAFVAANRVPGLDAIQ